ncbi:hypothetical protein KY331_03310 [Candidatus Woesearchaeota archaeon]|nr:hypothetical protein [Candidatus Woesearchaeota archaeon]
MQKYNPNKIKKALIDLGVIVSDERLLNKELTYSKEFGPVVGILLQKHPRHDFFFLREQILEKISFLLTKIFLILLAFLLKMQ